MKDEQIIKKLHLLKTMQPTHAVLTELKENINQRIRRAGKTQTPAVWSGNIFTLLQSYKLILFSATFAVLLAVSLSIFSFVLPQQLHTFLLYSKLTFASNQYQKAQIALSDTTNRFANKKITQTNFKEVSQSLALANTTLHDLKLKGEKGKYTEQECHHLYENYLTYLENEEKNISSNSFELALLRAQIHAYKEQAEKRLHMYDSV